MPRTSPFEARAFERFLELTGVQSAPSTHAHDDTRIVGRDGRPMSVSMRRLAAPTRFLLESAILHAAAEQRLEGPSLVILSVSKLVPRMLDRVQDLLDGAEVHAAVISDAGGAWIRCPALGIVTDAKDEPGRVSENDDKERRLEFPDATAWMLKVLLLSRLQNHPRWWGGYRGRIRTGAELAERAGVSPSMVSHLFDLLRSRSWLRVDRSDEIVITRPRALLEAWLSQARHRLPRSIPVRPLYGAAPTQAGDILDWLAGMWQQRQGNRAWAVNGWMACNLQETGFVTDIDQRRVSITCLGDHQALMKAWELIRCDERDAMFVIQPSASPRSISGGIVHGLVDSSAVVAPSLPVVDVIQAALDVAPDPARGFEQAEHICKSVIEEIDP
jgi:hypothetical protein